MRVTNEQAKWLKEYDRLEDIRNLSADLLEARELIKEMREALTGFNIGTCFCDCGIDNPMMSGKHTSQCIHARDILDRTKDYS